MKLFNYEVFSNNDIHKICRKYQINEYSIKSKDGQLLVDVDHYVDLWSKRLNILPLNFNRVNGYFDCSFNNLTSLEGAPNYVSGNFNCRSNNLTSLEKSPEYVGLDFNCSSNKLTSLEGTPKSVMRALNYMDNELMDFKGFPEDYDTDHVFFDGNPVNQILMPIPSEKKCQFIHLINEYEVIRDRNAIVVDRLEAAYEGIGMEPPKNLSFNNYQLI